MSDFKQLIQTLGIGLNVDDDLTIIDGSRYINNISFSEDGYNGVAVNSLGNTVRNTSGFNYPFLTSYPTFNLPSGTNTVIFVLENKEENAVIVFVHNSNGDHCIYQYYHSTKTIIYILYGATGIIGNILNFSLSHTLDAVLTGNEDDKYLIWVDGYNEPRMINLLLAINYTKGITPAYTSITENTIRFYKKPLLENLTVNYVNSSLTDGNNLRMNLWQFAIRCKFLDNSFSVLSPYSEVKIPNQEENANGLFTKDILNNGLTIYFTPETDDDFISEYQLCYRKVDIGSGASGNWYLSDIKSTESAGNIIFNFYNDFNGVILAPDDAARVYDFVPDLANHVSVLDENIVCFGGITEGYDNVDDLDVVLTHSYETITETDIQSISAVKTLDPTGTSPVGGSHSGSNGVYVVSIPGIIGVNVYRGNSISNTTLGTSGHVISNTTNTITTDILWNTGNYFSINTEEFWLDCTKLEDRDWQYIFVGGSTPDIVSFSNTGGVTDDFVASYLAGKINSFASVSAVSVDNYVVITNTAGLSYTLTSYVIDCALKYRSFPNGSKHLFGIQYFNNGKPFFIQTDGLGINGKFCVSIPYEYEAANSSYLYEWRSFLNNVNWQIKHNAPDYATHYQWCYLGSDVGYYEEYFFNILEDIEVGTEGDGDYLSISKNIFTKSAKAFGGSSVSYGGFDVAVGDKIRFIGVFDFHNVQTPSGYIGVRDDIRLFNEYLEYDIVYVDDSIIKIKNQAISILNVISGMGLLYNIDKMLIRIIRSSNISEQSGYYQSISPIYKIENNMHCGKTVSGMSMPQLRGVHIILSNNSYLFTSNPISVNYVGFPLYNITTGASTIITSIVGNYVFGALSFDDWDVGDEFLIPAIDDFNPYFAHNIVQRSAYINSRNIEDYLAGMSLCYGWRDSYSVSPMYNSRIDFFGKSNIINEFSKRQYKNALRHGNRLIDDSGVNYISKFDFSDYKTVNDKYGVIEKMNQRGDVLRVYQKRKVTSFPLGVTSSINPDGSTTYVFSDDVLGDGVASYNDYGCTHFSSFVHNVRASYFFDIINGCVVRDSVNGLDDVSFKMSGYFKDKAKDILEYGESNVLILGGYDDYTGYYVLSFIVPLNLSHTINDTIAFDEKENKWKTHYSFLPRYMCGISGQTLTSFRDGLVYTHNDNTIRNNFYGTQYNSELWIHGVEGSSVSRVFDGVDINSTGQWTCPDAGDVLVTLPIEMQSRLVAGRFVYKEGIYFASFLRDMLNGGSTPKITYLTNGRKLRGHEITLKLHNTNTSLSVLRSVSIKSSLSK